MNNVLKKYINFIFIISTILSISSFGTNTSKISANGGVLNIDCPSLRPNLEKINDFLEGTRDYLTLGKDGHLTIEHYNTWTDLTSYPSERSHHSMVFDSTHNLVILFGGYGEQYFDDTWIYNYTDNSWTNMNPITKPSRRSSASMVYDSTHDQVILYGGVYIDYNLEEPITCFNDLWIYTYSNNSWTEMKPTINPASRYQHSMVYDSTRDQVILFGGRFANYEINRWVYYNDTWSYTYSNNSWTKMNLLTKPSSRYSSSMVYDSTHDCIILFGGNERYQSILFGPDPDMKDDTWIYNCTENSWTNMNPLINPSARDGHSMVYDTKNNQTILFGGWDKNLYDNRDTWIYIYSSNSWINVNPTTKPSAREDHSMVYDSIHDCVILFGGQEDNDIDNSWWIYNYTINTWTRVVLAPTSRSMHSMVYDSTHNQVILFGGYSSNSRNSETWIYTYINNSWTELKPATSPNPRYEHSMVYDSIHDCVILFGGYGDQYYDGTWIYTYINNSWTKLNPLIKPSARCGHTMVYDSIHDQVILFGGHADHYYYDDMWIYNITKNTWTNMNPLINPSARYGHSMVYDSTHDQVILFGGRYPNSEKTGWVYYNDTWIYTYSNNSWRNENPIIQPSARSHHSMVYDSNHDQVILFGGCDEKDDTWIYNYTDNIWIDLNPLIQPWAGGGHSMIYDSKNDQVILFGGPKNPWDKSDKTWNYRMSNKYFQEGIFASKITSFNEFYKISGAITWNPIDQPFGTSLQVQVGFSNTPFEEDFLYTALNNEFFTFQGICKFIKYRIIFQSNYLQNETPLLKSVNFTYTLESLYNDELNIPLILSLSVGFSLGIGMGIGAILSIFLRKKRKINNEIPKS